MNRFPTVLVLLFSVLCLFPDAASAKWSLLEEFQMSDVTGDEGLCLSSMKADCDFDIQKYTVLYPDDELIDDIDESREDGIEMILDAFAPRQQHDPFPAIVTTFDTPVPGEPFFQSDWYAPGFSGWERLVEKFFDLSPPP